MCRAKGVVALEQRSMQMFRTTDEGMALSGRSYLAVSLKRSSNRFRNRNQKRDDPCLQCGREIWRRGGDSNPR